MTALDDKIELRMNTLQEMMETNLHLVDPTAVSAHIDTVSKFWTRLCENDQVYIECARHAIEQQMEWKV